MKLIRGLYNLPSDWKGCVVTIGNFDGLHMGHQALVQQCVSLAKKRKLSSVLMTFEPYPQAYFSNDERVARLMGLRDKFLTLAQLGVDYLLVLPFNANLASLSAEDFIQKLLVNKLKIAGIVVGDDFRFGSKRAGDFSLLLAESKRYAFEVQQMPTLLYGNERVSSSRLRRALEAGDLILSKALLGRDYHLSGQVVKGDQRGREFGFPTANIYVSQKKLPLSGIFVVEVDSLETHALQGVASVGYRPMYPTKRDLLEVFLLDFNKDIYKKHVRVRFLKYLRGEKMFSSEAALIVQIRKDVDEAGDYFRSAVSS